MHFLLKIARNMIGNLSSIQISNSKENRVFIASKMNKYTMIIKNQIIITYRIEA